MRQLCIGMAGSCHHLISHYFNKINNQYSKKKKKAPAMHWHGCCRWAEKGGGLAGMGWAGLDGQLAGWDGWMDGWMDGESWLALLLTIHQPLLTGHCAQYQGFYYNAIVNDCRSNCISLSQLL